MKVIADMDYSETVYLTPAEYKIAMMKDNSNAVLSRSDALCLRGYGNWDYEETIQVYSTKQLEKPFECHGRSAHVESAISRIPLCEFMKIRLKSGRSLQRNTKNMA